MIEQKHENEMRVARISSVVLLLVNLIVATCAWATQDTEEALVGDPGTPTDHAHLQSSEWNAAWKALLIELEGGERPPLFLPGDTDSGGFKAFPEAVRDDAGRLRALFGFAERGLTEIGAGEDAESALRRFVRDHPGLWALEGSPDPWSSGTLFLEHDQSFKDPEGNEVHRIEYSQTWNGWPVLNGNVVAVFWAQRLASITGPIVAPDASLAVTTLAVSETQAASIALEGYGKRFPGVAALQKIHPPALDLDRGLLVYRIDLVPDPSAPLSSLVDPHRVTVDASRGVVVLIESLVGELDSEPGRFFVYVPRRNQEAPNAKSLAWREGFVTTRIAANGERQVFPWLDEVEAPAGLTRSPVPVFSGRRNWNGRLGFHWHSNPANNEFRHSPARAPWIFEQDHVSYWAQRAVRMADLNMRWFSPSDPAYRSSEVAVITSGIRNGAVAFWDGCPANWGNPWGGHGEAGQTPKHQCVTLASGITNLGSIFHEIGHTVNYKFLLGDTLGGSCNRSGLSEAQAGVYALTAFLHEFGRNTRFTDFDAVGGELTPLVANRTVEAHDNDAGRLCAARSEEEWCDQPLYRRGHPLMQAVWEAAHGMDCEDGPGCRNFNDGHTEDRARWATFYAMMNTGKNGMRVFVGHFLDYYYQTAGRGPWGLRWWVFNHHRLVGRAAHYEDRYEGRQCS